jgi:hypothetical protein
MTLSLKRVSTSVFLFALFCFLLPFVTLSCPGGQFTFSGRQIVTGTTVSEPQMFGPAKERKLDGEPLAFMALLCAFAGFGVGLGKIRQVRFVAAALGAAGIVSLLLLKHKIDSDVLRQTGGMMRVSYDAGYWLSFLAFVTAAISNLFVVKPSPAPRGVDEQAAPTS